MGWKLLYRVRNIRSQGLSGVCLPEVVSTGPLSESRSWDDADTRVLQQLESVEGISRHAGLLGLGDGFRGQMKLFIEKKNAKIIINREMQSRQKIERTQFGYDCNTVS